MLTIITAITQKCCPAHTVDKKVDGTMLLTRSEGQHVLAIKFRFMNWIKCCDCWGVDLCKTQYNLFSKYKHFSILPVVGEDRE